MIVQVVKADGSIEGFKANKLKKSLRRAGANNEQVKEIIGHLESELHDRIRTQEIYSHAFKLLRESDKPVAARYSLRRALFNLGPTGFPFEDFIARLLQKEGYQTKTRQIIRGKCALHELDVIAYNKEHSFVLEAKFHSRPGVKSDLQVALYSYARLLDLSGVKVCNDDVCGVTKLWLVTNTKFTTTAQEYANCVGLDLLSWDYPKHNNLHDRIQRAQLYPITVLQSLNSAQKSALIKRNVIICSDIINKPHLLRHLHLSTKKIEAVLSEARQLCH
jgi:hypothetical protein